MMPDRTMLARASILAVSLCAIVLAALFAERRQHAATLLKLNETLEQRVEAEIRERLQIWNVSQDLLVVADLEGRYLSVNPAWTVSLG